MQILLNICEFAYLNIYLTIENNTTKQEKCILDLLNIYICNRYGYFPVNSQ